MNKLFVERYELLEQQHWWFRIRKKIILYHFKKKLRAKDAPLKILNVGAASGYSSQWLSQLGNVTSVENDEIFFEILDRKRISYINASITSLPFDAGSFDLVCAFDVIEHVAEDALAVNELLRVCKKDGMVCATVPAFQMLWSKHDEVAHHFKRYTTKSFLPLFWNSEFKNNVVYKSYFNTLLFFPILFFRKINQLVTKNKIIKESDFETIPLQSFLNKFLYVVFYIEYLLLKIMRMPFGVSYFVITRKK